MTGQEIGRQRLVNQRIASRSFEEPDQVVRWLGAVQAQDYLGSLWAVGLRMRQASDKLIERAISERKIIRTWPMRGTLHFVAPEDVRWMLKLLAPRVVKRNTKRLLRDYGVDEATIVRSREVFQEALQGGKQLTRLAAYETLEAAHIPAAGQRGLHILWWLAQEGLVCFGARQGRQPSFTLLDEWVPSGKMLDGEEALGELARRYFTSHGPATLQDFMWWTGLTKAEASIGIENAKPELEKVLIEGQEYLHAPESPEMAPHNCTLLPLYDEYLVGYTDRRAAFELLGNDGDLPGYGIMSNTIVIDGQVVGTWKKAITKKSVVIKPELFKALSIAEERALAGASERYATFLGLVRTQSPTRL